MDAGVIFPFMVRSSRWARLFPLGALYVSLGLFVLGSGQLCAQGFTPTGGIMTDSRVRMRAAPDLGAATIGYLALGDPVEVIARSQERQKVQDLNDYWYRVRGPDGKDGWTFGAFIDLLPANPGAVGVASCGCGDLQTLRSDLGHLNVAGFPLGSLIMVAATGMYQVWVPTGPEGGDPSSPTFHLLDHPSLKLTYSASFPAALRKEAANAISGSTGFVLTNPRRAALGLDAGLADIPSRTFQGSSVRDALAVDANALLIYVSEGTYADDAEIGTAQGPSVPLSGGHEASIGFDCSRSLRALAHNGQNAPLFFKAVRVKLTPQGTLVVDAANTDHDFYQLDFSKTGSMFGP